MKEFWEVTAELAELVEYGGDVKVACAKCPYADQCKKNELYWGCCAWEQSMGDDL